MLFVAFCKHLFLCAYAFHGGPGWGSSLRHKKSAYVNILPETQTDVARKQLSSQACELGFPNSLVFLVRTPSTSINILHFPSPPWTSISSTTSNVGADSGNPNTGSSSHRHVFSSTHIGPR